MPQEQQKIQIEKTKAPRMRDLWLTLIQYNGLDRHLMALYHTPIFCQWHIVDNFQDSGGAGNCTPKVIGDKPDLVLNHPHCEFMITYYVIPAESCPTSPWLTTLGNTKSSMVRQILPTNRRWVGRLDLQIRAERNVITRSPDFMSGRRSNPIVNRSAIFAVSRGIATPAFGGLAMTTIIVFNF